MFTGLFDYYHSHGSYHRYLIRILVVITIAFISYFNLFYFEYHWTSPIIILDATQPTKVSPVTTPPLQTKNEEENWLKLGLDQYDPLLEEIVKKKFLISPPPQQLSTNKYNESLFTNEQSTNDKFEFIDKLLGPGPGFFIECGANDGIYLSNTLRLEKTRNWTGLLIEPHPYSFQRLLQNKRNAWAVNAALCIRPVAQEIPFWIHFEKNTNNSAVSSQNKNTIKEWAHHEKFVKISVPCVPLYTILKAISVSKVDFFSLDVESAELGILGTIPFEKILFKALAIENNHVDGGKAALRRFLKPKGYLFVKNIGFDSIFVHKSMRGAVIKKFTKNVRVDKVDN